MAVDITEYHSIHRTGERADLWIQRTHAEQGRTGSDGGLRLDMEERRSVKMKRENVRSFEEHERTLIGRWFVPFDLATDQEDERKRGNDGGYCMIYEAHAVSLFGHWAWYGSFGFLFWAKRIYPHTPFNFALFTLTVHFLSLLRTNTFRNITVPVQYSLAVRTTLHMQISALSRSFFFFGNAHMERTLQA